MRNILVWGIFAVAGIGLAQQNSSAQDCNNVVGDAYMTCIYHQLQETRQQLEASQEQAMQAQREALEMQNTMLQEQQQMIESQQAHIDNQQQQIDAQQQRIQDLQQDCKPLKNEKGSDGWILVYENNFANPIYGMTNFNFTRRTYRENSSGKNNMLGPMHSDTLIFDLCSLPKHTRIKFSFDTYFFGSWEAEGQWEAYRDKWYLKSDDRVVTDAVYGLYLGGTAHRIEDFSSSVYPYTSRSLQYDETKSYSVNYEQEHSSDSYQLQIAVNFIDIWLTVENESWTIDNLKVWVLEE